MEIKDIREALKDHPHIKKVWVTSEGYHTVRVHGAVELDLFKKGEPTNETVKTEPVNQTDVAPQNEVKTTKQRKKK